MLLEEPLGRAASTAPMKLTSHEHVQLETQTIPGNNDPAVGEGMSDKVTTRWREWLPRLR